MAEQWFCHLEGRAVGPFAPRVVVEMAAAGQITPDTLVRKGTDGTWREASKVSGLAVHILPCEVSQSLVPCADCGRMTSPQALSCPGCGRVNIGGSRSTAMKLAFTLGGVGVHKFYMGQTGLGLVYLAFCWTLIPALAALMDGLRLTQISDEEFARFGDQPPKELLKKAANDRGRFRSVRWFLLAIQYFFAGILLLIVLLEASHSGVTLSSLPAIAFCVVIGLMIAPWPRAWLWRMVRGVRIA